MKTTIRSIDTTDSKVSFFFFFFKFKHRLEQQRLLTYNLQIRYYRAVRSENERGIGRIFLEQEGGGGGGAEARAVNIFYPQQHLVTLRITFYRAIGPRHG